MLTEPYARQERAARNRTLLTEVLVVEEVMRRFVCVCVLRVLHLTAFVCLFVCLYLVCLEEGGDRQRFVFQL